MAIQLKNSIVATYFSEKWDKPICKSMAVRWYNTIKSEKDKGTKFEQPDQGRFRIHSSKMQFERELYNSINDRLLKQALTFELIKILALRLQRSATYASDKDVQSMRFSSQWWRQYKLHFGITVVRKQGSQSFFPESEIQSERSRLLSEMTGFHPCKLK